MKKVLAMSILTMIVMSMGGCGASSDSSSSQDVSSKAETESNSPYTVEADFSKGASNDFSISAGWSNGRFRSVQRRRVSFKGELWLWTL